MKSDKPILHWLLWGAVLLLVTVALVAMRAATEQTYVPITFLLVVLGGSAGGGRKLGFALAILSVLVIDYYLQTPYDNISIGKSIDLVTLAAYLVTAGVACRRMIVAGEPGRALDASAFPFEIVRRDAPPNDVPRATSVGRLAITRAPDDADAVEPLYVRAPDITRPRT